MTLPTQKKKRIRNIDPEIKLQRKQLQQARKTAFKRFLASFPDDTDLWKDATDELMDIARKVRELYNDVVAQASEGENGYVEAIDYSRFTYPGKRNKAYKDQILALFPKLPQEHKDEVMDEILLWKQYSK